MKLLLVEDDPNDVFFMTKAFAQICPGFAFTVAADGEAALAALAGGGSFSHVLLDLKLPRKSGLEVLRWVRSEPGLAALHVVVLTSSSEKPDFQQTSALGIDGYYVKPVSFQELLDVTRKICALWGITSPTGTEK